MLIVRAPVRISFGGGGTDLEAYYARHGGLVVSAAINKYFYVITSAVSSDSVQIFSSDYGLFEHHNATEHLIWNGNLALPKTVVDHFGLKRGLHVFLASEIPPGTGLGSSSTVAVALVQAFSTLCEQSLSRQQVAEISAQIEIEKMGMPIGKQDQYAAACGGLNVFTFRREGVRVEPLNLSDKSTRELESSLLLFFLGTSRKSSQILREQKASSESGRPEVLESLHAIKARAMETREALEAGDLEWFGELLHSSWQSKKRLANGITNSFIDQCYDAALECGALGGKVTGAGGGGFLMLCCPEARRPQVVDAMEARGLQQMEFKFDHQGVKILLNTLQFDRSWFEARGGKPQNGAAGELLAVGNLSR